MKNRKQSFKALILISIITLFFSIFYAYRQVRETIILDQYLDENNLISLPKNKETAFRVSEQVRRDFEVNEKNFSKLNVEERPFLREDASFLLTHKEGHCGEGARVIICLLNRIGFDACRVGLYDKYLKHGHTVVSVIIQDEEFIVDSINSPEGVNESLKRNIISLNNYNIIYSKKKNSEVEQKLKADYNRNIRQEDISAFKYYRFYSYESIPFTKLLRFLGFNVIVLNPIRTNKWVSALAEQPNKIMFIICILASIFFLCLSLLIHLPLLRNNLFILSKKMRKRKS